MNVISCVMSQMYVLGGFLHWFTLIHIIYYNICRHCRAIVSFFKFGWKQIVFKKIHIVNIICSLFAHVGKYITNILNKLNKIK